MSAKLPRFDAGEFPFAEPPPRECYWCHGVSLSRWALDHVDHRWCGSVTETHCFCVPSDLAAVCLDRVAEAAPNYARVRVEIKQSVRYIIGGLADEMHVSNFEGRRFVNGDVIGETPELHAICHAHPTPSQHLAAMLMHDPEIDALLRHIRGPNEEAQEALRVRGSASDVGYLSDALGYMVAMATTDADPPLRLRP